MSQKDKMILDMVRKQLQRPNPPGTEVLYARAARIDEGIRELSLRQFNARYPLRVRREMARAKKKQGREEADISAEDVEESLDRALGEDRRTAIRNVLLEFAREVVQTPTGPGLVDLVEGGIDEHVDRAITAARANWDQT